MERKRKSVLDGIPKQLPTLLHAYQIQARAARVGFDWSELRPVLGKVHEEMKELELSIQQRNQASIKAELGDLFFALINMARFLKVDPEEVLRKANQRFSARFHSMEKKAKKSKRLLSDMTLAEMDQLWDEAKAMEKKKAKRSAG